jgi:hypothetical protein
MQICIHYFCSSQGDGLSPLAFTFKLGYATREVHENQEGLDLNGLNELLVYDVNFLGKGEKRTHARSLSRCVLVTELKRIVLFYSSNSFTELHTPNITHKSLLLTATLLQLTLNYTALHSSKLQQVFVI